MWCQICWATCSEETFDSTATTWLKRSSNSLPSLDSPSKCIDVMLPSLLVASLILLGDIVEMLLKGRREVKD